MSNTLIFVLIYLSLGFCIYMYFIWKEDKENRESFLCLFVNDGLGLAFSAVFWPVLIAIFLIERKILDKQSSTKETDKQSDLLIGSKGITKTKMMPMGKIQIGGEILDAICTSGPLDTGVEIEITGRESNYYKVRKYQPLT